SEADTTAFERSRQPAIPVVAGGGRNWSADKRDRLSAEGAQMLAEEYSGANVVDACIVRGVSRDAAGDEHVRCSAAAVQRPKRLRVARYRRKEDDAVDPVFGHRGEKSTLTLDLVVAVPL